MSCDGVVFVYPYNVDDSCDFVYWIVGISIRCTFLCGFILFEMELILSGFLVWKMSFFMSL